MPSVFLYPGNASPSDVTLRDTTAIALGAIATTGSGAAAVSLIKVGIEVASESGSGADAVTLRKVGVLAPASSGSGNAAIVIIDIESLSPQSSGQSTVGAAVRKVSPFAAASAGASTELAAVVSVGSLSIATGGSGGDALVMDVATRGSGGAYAGRGALFSKSMSELYRAPKARRPSRVKRLKVATIDNSSDSLLVAHVGHIAAASIDQSNDDLELDNDELLNTERFVALTLLAAA